MNNNENNDFTNIQPQDNTMGGNVPPLNSNIEQPINPVPEVNLNMAVPQMEQPVNSVPEVNPNMAAPQMEQPVNPVPEVNPNMAAPQMEQPVNPVPEVNPNMAAPQMEQPINPVPPMNQNMAAPQMEQPVNPVPEVNPNMAVPQMEQPINPVPPMNQNMTAVPPINQNINNKKPGFMSQYGKYVFIALIVIVLAAVAYLVFGGKKLECTMEDEYAGMKMTQTMQVKFSGNKANYVQMIMNIDLSNAGEEMQEYKDIFVETLKEQTEEYKKEGMTVDVKENASSIVVTITAKKDGMSLLEMGEDEDTFDEIKKSLQKEGYTCK